MSVDYATRKFLSQLAKSGGKRLHDCTPEEARVLSAALANEVGPAPEMARVEEHSITALNGVIRVRLLVPIEPSRGVIVYYHGGGWVLGSIDEYDTLGRKLAERPSCAVVMVDYRLAPEHPFPTPVDDSYSALEWTATHLIEIAGRQDVPLIVMGDSAGGNLSAVIAQRARDRGGPSITLQVLVYPVTDSDFQRPSYTDPDHQLLLTREGMAWFWEHYLPDESKRTDPDASPLRAPNLAGLPPAVVLTAEHDPLREEGEEYAKQLEDGGVPVNFKRYVGQTHGFFQLLMLPGSERGFQQIVKAIHRCVVRYAKGKDTL